jgi:hypothetical protein
MALNLREIAWVLDSSGFTAGTTRFPPSFTQAFFVFKVMPKPLFSWSDRKSYGVKVSRVAAATAAPKIDTPEKAVAYWRAVIPRQRWFDAEKEHMFVLLLSTRYNVRGYSLVSIGSMNASIAHPREIFRAAVAGGAYAIILMHNHPSGDPSPSESDRMVTQKIEKCGDILEIKLLDHVIVGDGKYWSFKENPEMPSNKKKPRARRPAGVRKIIPFSSSSSR